MRMYMAQTIAKRGPHMWSVEETLMVSDLEVLEVADGGWEIA